MNARIFLLSIIFISHSIAMSGPETPKDWKHILLRDLFSEIAALKINREEKMKFVQEQQAKLDDIWTRIRVLSFKFPSNVKITQSYHVKSTNAITYFIEKDSKDYSEFDIDELQIKVENLKAQLELIEKSEK